MFQKIGLQNTIIIKKAKSLKKQESVNRFRIDSIDIIKIEDIDYKKYYKIDENYFYKYNNEGNLISTIHKSKKTTRYKHYKKIDSKNRVLESYKTNESTGSTFGEFYKYYEENGVLKRKIFGKIFAEHFAATIKKYASYIYVYNLDNSYSVKVYNNNSTELKKSFHYDEQKNLTFIKDDESNIVEAYKYSYDKKGNWISVEKTGGVFPGKFTRTIEYYN